MSNFSHQKRKIDQISNDINPSNDELTKLSREIYYHYHLTKYQDQELSLYQIAPQKYHYLVVCPDFVRDDGIVIHIQVVQNDHYLRSITEETIHLTMKILNLTKSILVTVYLNENLNIKEMGSWNSKSCYQYLTEKIYQLNESITNHYLSLLLGKKQKTTQTIDNTEEDPESLELLSDSNENYSPETDVVGFDAKDWVSASKTRNFALKDTLIDWLDLWYHEKSEAVLPSGRHFRGVSDVDFDFPKFLMNKGRQFEYHVINLIKSKVKSSEFVTICADMSNFYDKIVEYETRTIKEIMAGTPFIYQGVLLNRRGKLKYSYGICDLIVRSDYLSQIVSVNPLSPTKINFKAPNLRGNYHYVIVDIKFTTLDLCVDGKRIRNCGSVPAYKCQIYIYQHALGRIQGYEPKESYILGRKYRYESKGRIYSGNDCFSRLGHIQYDDWDSEYIQETIDAVNWIRKLRAEGKQWTLLPQPSVPELYPNMSSSNSSHWDNIKMEYAEKIGEITLLWNCGVKNREIAHKNEIYSFRDPDCTAEALGVKGPKLQPILDAIINVNRRKDFQNAMDKIEIKINNKIDNRWMESSPLQISVDFETISVIFDDFKQLPQANDQCYLYLIGIGYRINGEDTRYKLFLISELSKNAEFQMIYQFYQFIRSLTDAHLGSDQPIPPLYHWGHIERTFFSGLCTRLVRKIGNDIENDIKLFEDKLDWYDLSECFKGNPIVINGCYKFGLKEVSKRLRDIGLIKTTWPSGPCHDGNTAMIMANKAYEVSKAANIPVNQVSLMKKIIEYNKVDCLVIHEIIDVMRMKINEDK